MVPEIRRKKQKEPHRTSKSATLETSNLQAGTLLRMILFPVGCSCLVYIFGHDVQRGLKTRGMLKNIAALP